MSSYSGGFGSLLLFSSVLGTNNFEISHPTQLCWLINRIAVFY